MNPCHLRFCFTMAQKLTLVSLLATSCTANYQIFCATDNIPRPGPGAALCELLSKQATSIFKGTLDGNFSLLIGSRKQGRLVEARFGIDEKSVETIASASKWINAAAMLKWLDSTTSKAALSKPVQEYVPWWNQVSSPDDPRQLVTMEHMLSQTDGFGETLGKNFTEDGPTIYAKDYANLAVPQKIFTAVPIEKYTGKMTGFDEHPSPYTWGKTPDDKLPKPGQTFYYEETHWRLAASIIQAAAGVGLDNVTAGFARDLGMKNSKLVNIPQLGGPEWVSTAEDMETFLQHVVRRDILKRETQKAFETSHTTDATWYGFRMRPTWGYAMGSWAHCPDGSCKQFSSIGIFGTLPFVDFDSGLYYALVRPAGLDPKRGVFLDRSVAFWEATFPQVKDLLAPYGDAYTAEVVV